MSKCSICNAAVDSENAPVLTMGGAGYARYLCDECAADLDTATLSPEVAEISDAIQRISKKMTDSTPDRLTFTTVTELFSAAMKRAKLIKSGEYDFSLDTQQDDNAFDELPEELAESEEDKEKDRIDEEKGKKFDKVFNVLIIAVAAIALGVIVYRIVQMFL